MVPSRHHHTAQFITAIHSTSIQDTNPAPLQLSGKQLVSIIMGSISKIAFFDRFKE